MTPVEQLEAALRSPKSSTALVAYLTAGWPTKEAFTGHPANIARVADAVEIGVPSPTRWRMDRPSRRPAKRPWPTG